MAKTAMKEPDEPKKIRVEEPAEQGPSGERAQTRYRNETREEFFARHKMEPVEALDYANRRAMWLAHRQKRNKDDMMNRAFEKAENENSAWWEDLGNDLQRFDVDQKWILENCGRSGV